MPYFVISTLGAFLIAFSVLSKIMKFTSLPYLLDSLLAISVNPSFSKSLGFKGPVRVPPLRNPIPNFLACPSNCSLAKAKSKSLILPLSKAWPVL